jgi:hypothetical protein
MRFDEYIELNFSVIWFLYSFSILREGFSLRTSPLLINPILLINTQLSLCFLSLSSHHFLTKIDVSGLHISG